MKRYRPLLVVLVFAMVSLACQVGYNFSFPQGSAQSQTEETRASTATAVPQATAQPAQVQLIAPDLADVEQLQIALYQQVSPGVVSIQTLDETGGVQGSGFVYDTDGHIITNYHVVQDAGQIEVDFPSGIKIYGEVIGIDIDSDIAVIKVDVPAAQLFPVTLGDSDALQIGQTVYAIGNPYGLTGTMTVGIVSAKGRTLDSLRTSGDGSVFSAGDLIQTDASINPGNSGGPLLNLAGEVVGINRAIRLSGTTELGEPINTGIGFAISVNILKRVVPDLISKGSYDYPYVGISARPELTLIEAEALGLSQTAGAYVVEVMPNGPAARAGLRAGTTPTEYLGLNSGGDLITGIDGLPVRNFGDFLGYLMTRKSPGDVVTITFLRNNEELQTELTLEMRP
jgi:S1-C subfamily serine protease